jgi:GGDEF domain-containing protein
MSGPFFCRFLKRAVFSYYRPHMAETPDHSRIRPLATDSKFTLVGYLVVIGAIIGVFLKWKEFAEFFFPEGSALNWKFFTLSIVVSASTVWFIMNHFWKKEYHAHYLTIKDRDNLAIQLRISENERLTDIITGIPNSRSLEKDIDQYFATRQAKKMQFILIDLKDFRQINKKYGFTKTNNLLRTISQSIYKSMRRNEDMYKYFDGENRKVPGQDGFYRIYPGGDEFAFIIEGDQAEALGFTNRLVDQFNFLSKKTKEILGEQEKLSFYCALIEMDARDTYADVFKKAEDCYQIAKEGHSDFNICWHPINLEQTFAGDPFKSGIYKKTRALFEILTLKEVE